MAKGRFIPKNPQKYVGNVNKVVFRSSWELMFMKWLDANNAVLRWGSEELSIPYINPIKTAEHQMKGGSGPIISQYYPDFIILYRDTAGNVKKEIVEVKPLHEATAATAKSERDKMALAVNTAKWKAASIFAESQGATFRVITEKTMFRQVEKPKRKKK